MCFTAWPLLSYCDLFQTNITLFFNQKKKRSTKIGTIFSLALIILLVINFSESDLFVKKSPYVVSETLTNLHARPISFSDNTLMTIAVSDDNNVNYIDPSLFSVNFTIYHLKTDETGVFALDYQISSAMQACEVSDVAYDPTLIMRLGLTNAFCLTNKTFKLEGYWDENEIYYAEADLYPCDNATSQLPCKTPDDIKDFFSTPKYFGATFHSVVLQLNNYQQPMQDKYENIYQLIDLQLMKRFNVFFKQIDLSTDDGWFFSQKTFENNFLKDNYNFDFSMRKDNGVLSEIIFYASHDSQQNVRRYENLSEALASLAGMANFFMFFCFLITNFQSYAQTLKIILNSLYYFPNIEKKRNLKDSKNQDNIIERKTPDIGRSIMCLNIPNPLNTKAQMEEKRKESIKKEDKPNDESKMHYNTFDSHEINMNRTLKITRFNLDHPIQKNQSDDEFYLEHYSLPSYINNQQEILQNSKNNSNLEDSILKKSGFTFKSLYKTKQNLSKFLAFLFKDNHANEKTRTNQLSLGFFEYLYYYIKLLFRCKQTKKQRLIGKANELFTEELDVIKILTKIHEIEKLKLLLLNQDQLVLFDSISKPMALIDETAETPFNEDQLSSIKMTNLIKDYKVSNKRKTIFSNSYEKIKLELTNNTMNKRLMELVDKNINNFNKYI